jgi:hypothetical protein
MENIREKSSFVRMMEKYQGDKTISIEELYNKFKSEIEENKKAEEENDNKVISEFSNSYLKLFTEEGMFGRSELEVLKIDSLKVESYTDNWDRTYLVKGTKISVGICGVTVREFDTSVHSTFTEPQLIEYSKISKEEFESFLEEANSISDRINALIKK